MRAVVVLFGAAALVSCSALVDATLEGDDPDVRLDCTGVMNGDRCGEGFVCVDEVCTAGSCGDGVRSGDEQCDDGNDVAGDGCEESCTFSCETNEGCDDGNVCNGEEICNLTTNSCDPGGPADDLPCEADGSEGLCRDGACVPAGCGNRVVDGDEQCDYGDEPPGNGCEIDCTFTCEMDEDCLDADMCNGTETCVDNDCVAGDPLDCDDGEPCTDDRCEAAEGCMNDFIDNDGDGVSPEMCVDPTLKGGDCEDANNTIYPDAPELCDGINNDCDGVTDEDIVEVECRADMDGDRVVTTRVGTTSCSCSEGTLPYTDGAPVDCLDTNPDVYQGQTEYFSTPRTSGCVGRGCFDYNCDGSNTKQYPDPANCRRVSGICTGSGFVDTSPACGERAPFRNCLAVGEICTSLPITPESVQRCR